MRIYLLVAVLLAGCGKTAPEIAFKPTPPVYHDEMHLLPDAVCHSEHPELDCTTIWHGISASDDDLYRSIPREGTFRLQTDLQTNRRGPGDKHYFITCPGPMPTGMVPVEVWARDRIWAIAELGCTVWTKAEWNEAQQKRKEFEEKNCPDHPDWPYCYDPSTKVFENRQSVEPVYRFPAPNCIKNWSGEPCDDSTKVPENQ